MSTPVTPTFESVEQAILQELSEFELSLATQNEKSYSEPRRIDITKTPEGIEIPLGAASLTYQVVDRKRGDKRVPVLIISRKVFGLPEYNQAMSLSRVKIGDIEKDKKANLSALGILRHAENTTGTEVFDQVMRKVSAMQEKLKEVSGYLKGKGFEERFVIVDRNGSLHMRVVNTEWDWRGGVIVKASLTPHSLYTEVDEHSFSLITDPEVNTGVFTKLAELILALADEDPDVRFNIQGSSLINVNVPGKNLGRLVSAIYE